MELWWKISRWITTLDAKRIAVFLLTVLVSLLLYRLYTLEQENVRINTGITILNDRHDSILGIYEQKLQECNNTRFQENKEVSEYWRKKFDELQERLYEEHQAVNKMKRK